MASKYPESNETKISLGPVYAINPRYVGRVKAVVFPTCHNEISHVAVYHLGGDELFTSELESVKWCMEKVAEFKRHNPAVVVDVEKH